MYTICFMYYGHLFCVAQILLSKPVDWIKGMTNLSERMKTSIYVLFQLNINSRCPIQSHSSKLHAFQKLSFREVADGITLDFLPVEDWSDTLSSYSLQLRLYVESFSCHTLFVPCEAHLGDQFID